MKSKIVFTSLILTALTALLSVSGLAGVGLLANPALQSGAPTVVSYQGQVTVSGSVYNGTGYFKFAIVNAAGESTYWSNDGTSTGGEEPTNGTPLPVSNGLFNVLLGDPSLTNMTQALTAAVFNGTERYLRVWFSQDNINFQQLSPDRRIAAVPYALQAQEAANADTLDGQDASAFSSAGHGHDGLLPAGAMVLSRSKNDTTLINAGFSYSGLVIEPEWSSKAEMPTGRYMPAAAAVDGIIYVIGGWSSTLEHGTKNEAYDPATNSWTTKAPMPTGRWGLAAAVANGIIYAIGGVSDSPLLASANEAYNPATNTWSSKANMPTGRSILAAATVDGVVYAIGGVSSPDNWAPFNEAYNPATNSWSSKEDMPTGRHSLTAAAVDGVIYAIGGEASTGSFNPMNEAYDPTTNSWSSRQIMPTGRQGHAAAVVNGVIYTIGGVSSPVYFETKNEAYDPATDSWSTSKADMPAGRKHLAAAAVDGVIYAIGGWSFNTYFETANEAYTTALYVYIKD